MMDDIVHEFAHHVETLFPELVYSDEALIHEFKRKRQELKFTEIKTQIKEEARRRSSLRCPLLDLGFVRSVPKNYELE